MADPTLVPAAGTMIDIVGADVAAWLDLIRNIALFSIAPVLYVAGMIVERSRATHQLIQRIVNPQILDIHERLRLSRLYKEGKLAVDPYATKLGRHDLLFDVVISLNYYEGICSEILSSRWWRGGVWQGFVYEAAGSMIIGQRDIILNTLTELTSLEDGSDPYPNIIKVAEASEPFLAKKGRKVFEKIPDRISDDSNDTD